MIYITFYKKKIHFYLTDPQSNAKIHITYHFVMSVCQNTRKAATPMRT